MFDLQNPLAVKCMIKGAFSGGGDPLIFVTCHVQNNTLSALGGNFTECSFDGVFTNNYMNGMGLTDANSAIKIYHLNAKYKEIPISIDTATINNLDNPVAQGTVHSKFDVQKINNVLGNQTLRFTKGDASLKLAVKANIVNFRLNKPLISGLINIAHADASYVPRNLNFVNTGISINFSGNNLLLNNIRLQTGRSIVLMQGRINNFLNLYYNAPEHILINWEIRSPQLYLAEFLGFLNARKNATPVKRPAHKATAASSDDFIDQFNNVFEKANADMHLSIANLHYKKFLATGVNADVNVSAEGITLKSLSSRQAGGSLNMSGQVIQGASVNNRFTLNSTVSSVNIRDFFLSFNNFGLSGLTAENLRGLLSAKANISGIVTNDGNVLPGSLNGTVAVNLKKGALLNYAPFKTIDKYLLSRDLSNITLDNLDGKFDIHGNKLTIEPMKINSSVLYMNVAGDYALTGKGTNIALDVPLRNPSRDKDITDEKQKEERRTKGIVVHLVAVDGDKGIKIKLK